VRFKAVAGRIDRAGGIAVRLIDADNYYVLRADVLEDNVNFYRARLAAADTRCGYECRVRSVAHAESESSRRPAHRRQLGVPGDPILCRGLGGEARGGLDHGTHLTERNAKTPVALNEDLVCCLSHWSDMVTLK
jgi:hypothetical protein